MGFVQCESGPPSRLLLASAGAFATAPLIPFGKSVKWNAIVDQSPCRSEVEVVMKMPLRAPFRATCNAQTNF